MLNISIDDSGPSTSRDSSSSSSVGSSERRGSGSRRHHRRERTEDINDINVRWTNFLLRAIEGEPGHPETRPEERDLQFGGTLRFTCSNLLQVLGVLSFKPGMNQLVRWVEHNWPITINQMPPELGKHSIIESARAGAASPLLIEAICQMMGIQLLVHRGDVENARSWKFGVTGPVHEVIREGPDRYAAFLAEPTIQFVESELFANEMDQWAIPVPPNLNRGPSPSPEREAPAEPEPQPEEEEEINELMEANINEDINGNEDININDNINEDHDANINDENNMAQEEEGPAQPRYFLRRPHIPRQPLRRQREPQVFRPHNIENLRPEHQAELTAPAQEAYHVDADHTVWCRLTGCARPNQPFKTVRAWKVHVQRAACHRGETLCTSCGHIVAMPSSAHLSAAEVKTFMDAHKSERCVGATRQVLKARKIAAERLVILGRDNSHIAVPDEGAEEVQVTSSNPRKRHLASEAAWRADQCCRYLKRFKEDHPDLMEQIGMEHQLTFN